MSQIANAPPSSNPVPDNSAASRDVQRQSLDQIVKLSIECAAEELRIEQHRAEALEKENAEFLKTTQGARERHKRKVGELAKSATQRQEAIQTKYETRKQAAETALQAAQRQVERNKEEGESAVRKQVDQASWQAESALVALQMRIDTEEQQFKQVEKTSEADLASIATLDAAVQEAMTRYRMEAFPVESPMDEKLNQRLAEAREAVLAENRTQAQTLLKELQTLTAPRVMDDVGPLFLIAAMAAVAGAVGWIVPHEQQSKVLAAGGAGVGAMVVGAIGWMILRHRKRTRIKAEAKTLYVPLMQAIAIARAAAKVDPEAAAAAREKKVSDARRKRDLEVADAREKAKAILVKSSEENRAALAAETQRCKEQLAAIEEEKERGLAELERTRAEKAQQIEQEYAAGKLETESQHVAALQTIETVYETDTRVLTERWSGGLRAVSDLLAVSGGGGPQMLDWNSGAWDQWVPEGEFSGQVRFGELKVNLAQLTEHLPKLLKLPDAFSVPAMLLFPGNASLLLESDHTGRAAGINLAQLVMARLLTQIPAGRAKFTIFDPVGLGQSFAGFMHLADHDESLIGSRIWTERDHMQQRLADLTEHMETVIQKYLRNEYATIDQYNAQAGELAEPFRFLVIADFPTGLEQESLRRLSSIVTTGPRCGVYTILLRDTRQAIPPGSRMEDIVAKSIRLQYKNGAFVWDDAVFKRFPLQIDAAPDEKRLTHLMDLVGKAAKQSKRIEVPFRSIAPKDEQFWTMSSKDDLRVPIGKTGATRLQALRLGVGVAQHALVAGKTGSGKSNLMHTIITNLAMWYGPDEVEFYLVDFKKGVEFKAYAVHGLPHARAIAVESDREFGLSVLQRVDGELTRRGALFRDAGVQEISMYRDKTGQRLPRTLLLIDEFQEFFTEDDKLSQEAAGLMDRLVRQGRAFGVHLVLGSQTIGGGSGVGRSTLGQIAVRVALQCTEADSQLILGDNNSAARLLTRPGEAIYNDAGGLVEGNSPFQIAYLPEEGREKYLEQIRGLAQSKAVTVAAPIVFEGNSAAAIRKNQRLMDLLSRPAFPEASSTLPAYVGEPVAIKEPTAVPFRRQGGGNLLMVGQAEESAIAIVASIVASLAAQHKPGDAIFYLMDGSPADSRYFGRLERLMAALPQQSHVVALKQVPESVNELAKILAERQGNEAHAGPAVYLLVFGLQRYRLLRQQEDDFSFSKSDEEAAPKPHKQFAELLSEGPALGLHSIIWADTPITIERTLERSSMRQFDHRILFQMSAADSSNLIDSPLANRLGTHRALLYSEEQGTLEKFRPYEVPDDAWFELLAKQLKNRSS